ncbi:MAG TPA: hypothetical protein VJ997_14680 [Longimicrobiales bacterium]|nr:hypothetical protein [Longimicrobiales bacterium]
MDALLGAAEAALRRSPAPALPLSQLTGEVRAATGVRSLEPLALLDALRCHPDHFKILDPGRGPWRFVARAEDASTDEPWIVSLEDPESPAEGYLADRLQRRLRASVRGVALALDADSPREVLRWHAMALAGASLAPVFRKKAA